MLCFPLVAKERAHTLCLDRIYKKVSCQFDMVIIKVKLYLIMLQYSSDSIKQALMSTEPSHPQLYLTHDTTIRLHIRF